VKHDSGSAKPKAASHYRVEDQGLSALAAAYPHVPEDYTASMGDYLEDMHSKGWSFITSTHDGNGYRYFFKAV